jgi:hypothetical protein
VRSTVSMSLPHSERPVALEVRLPMFETLLRDAHDLAGRAVAVYSPVDRRAEAVNWIGVEFMQRGFPSPL